MNYRGFTRKYGTIKSSRTLAGKNIILGGKPWVKLKVGNKVIENKDLCKI